MSASVITFNYKDKNSYDDLSLIVNDIRIPLAGSITEKTQDIPGKIGNLFFGNAISSRPIEIDITIVADSERDRFIKMLALSDLLSQTEATEYPLTLSHISEYTFYGHFVNLPALQRLSQNDTLASTTLIFTCSDALIHGPEKTKVINDPNSSDADPVITNEGTTDTYPIFTAEVLKPITLLQIVKDDAYMQVGQPVDVDSEEVPEFESVLSDNLSSLADWTSLTGGQALPGGIVGGSMHLVSNADGQAFAFGARTYGTNANGWVGPAVKRALSEAVQDFRVAINMSVLNKLIGVGKVVLFLADDTDTIFASLSMEDTTASVDLNHARIALLDSNQNNRFLIDTTGDRFNVYNNFEGMLRLERRGNRFFAYSAQVDPVTGVHSARDTAPVYIDSDSLYANKLASVIIYIAKVIIYIAKAKDYKTFTQTANDLSVFKINDLSSNQIPYVAQAGDIITFDHITKKLMLNGDPSLMQVKDFGSTFFPLAKGKNTLIVNPADAVRLTAQWGGNYK